LIIGTIILDKDRRELSINPVAHVPLLPRVGDIVIGDVMSTQEKILTLRIFQIDDTPLLNSFSGIMHISDVSQG